MSLKKIMHAVTVFVILLCALAGCNEEKDNNAVGLSSDSVVGSVTIFADGKEYASVQNWIYSLINNLAADGMRKQPQELANELIAIPLVDDFEIVIDGQSILYQRYTLFDDEYKKVYFNQEAFDAPENQGEYILCVEVAWGNEKECQGFQYFFKLLV